VRDWLSRIDKDSKEARNKRIFEMWMACHTQQEIAEVSNCDQKTVGNIVLGETADLPNFLKSHPAANHLTDFTPRRYRAGIERRSRRIGESESWWPTEKAKISNQVW
jgi:hypothetical protein